MIRVGGELLRVLIGHPEVKLSAATSRSLRGRRVDGMFSPVLRGDEVHRLDADTFSEY